MKQLTREDLYQLARQWQVPSPLDRIIVAGAWAESGWDADAEGDVVAGHAHSIGIFQLDDRGFGKGLTAAERRDPNQQFQVMVPRYRRSYAYWANPQAHWQGDLSLEEIAWRTCALAERPYGWQDPKSAAAHRYRRAWLMAAEDRRRPTEANRVYPFSRRAQYEAKHWAGLQAVDVFDVYGASIRACADGEVTYHAYPATGWTATLRADTPDQEGGQVYFHAHLLIGSGVCPEGGTARVIAGQEIGRVGDSGRAAGGPPHCHWAVGTPGYGVDYDGAGNIAPAPLLAAWQAAEGSAEVTNPDLINAIGYLTGEVADQIQAAVDSVREQCTEEDVAESLEAIEAALRTIRGYQAGSDDMATESVRDQMNGYRGAPLREARPDAEGPEAKAEREAMEERTPEAKHTRRIAEELGVPESEVPTDMVRDAVAAENEAKQRKQETTDMVVPQAPKPQETGTERAYPHPDEAEVDPEETERETAKEAAEEDEEGEAPDRGKREPTTKAEAEAPDEGRGRDGRRRR